MRAQGAVEYTMILGVIIIITVVVAFTITNIGTFDFITGTENRLNDIENLLSDVMIQKNIRSNGFIEAGLMSFRFPLVTDANITFFSEFDEPCKILIGTVRTEWVINSTECPTVAGPLGTAYSLRCVVSYVDPQNIIRSNTGVCKGIYEE